MKVLNSTLAIVMMAGAAAAQTKPAAQPAKPAAPPSQAVKGTAATQATTPTKATTTAAPKSPMSPKLPVKSAAKKPAAPAMSPKPAEKTSAAKEAPAPELERPSVKQAGKRDPFVSPIMRSSGNGKAGPGPECNSGKRCLMSGEISLVGVVRSATGMIAVVQGARNKTYFLKENDPLFNGFVTRITGDSMTIRESGNDQFGNPTSRDVVKKLNPTTT